MEAYGVMDEQAPLGKRMSAHFAPTLATIRVSGCRPVRIDKTRKFLGQ